MRQFLFVASFALVAACTQESAPEYANYGGERLQIIAKANPGLIDSQFIVEINGVVAVNQRSKPFGGSSQTFEGSYRGERVTARATYVEKLFSSYTMIDVFINGTLIDTLVI
ncbi:hypothetical protein [Actibacterium pelagium]|uniref:Lipoprotein n=1 Tax=Actibacterium pelagium TaxID=2029103 RepID=A0A917AI24_9RHOB|nr:hypothetical protein [Actibacterium pelagium]GGE54861.1 hypothetical protein GCM10011517_23160 [Actibacterium pelagium]